MLRNKKPPQDTEKIIITTLVSCAEATYRINKPKEIFCEKLVKGFFEPVKSKIRYKIRGSVGDNPRKKIFNPVEVLYLIRNDYVHNGNFTGLFFRSENSEDYAYNFGTFHFYEKKDKLKLIQANSECCLTYEQFLQIFLEAFIINIQDFYNNYSKIK